MTMTRIRVRVRVWSPVASLVLICKKRTPSHKSQTHPITNTHTRKGGTSEDEFDTTGSTTMTAINKNNKNKRNHGCELSNAVGRGLEASCLFRKFSTDTIFSVFYTCLMLLYDWQWDIEAHNHTNIATIWWIPFTADFQALIHSISLVGKRLPGNFIHSCAG